MRKIGLILIIILVISFASMSAYIYLLRTTPATSFSLKVIPEHIRDTITGQRVVFLVVVEDEGGEGGSGAGELVSITATAPSSDVTVEHKDIIPGQIAEVTVIPTLIVTNEEEVKNLTLTVTGERNGVGKTVTSTFQVNVGYDEPIPYAEEVRDVFVPWLAVNHPELGISDKTDWVGTIVRPQWLVVRPYLFFSDEWEMLVMWHVMIPPHDWGRIHLRHRFTETQYTYAFEISSLQGGDEPQAIDPQYLIESLYR